MARCSPELVGGGGTTTGPSRRSVQEGLQKKLLFPGSGGDRGFGRARRISSPWIEQVESCSAGWAGAQIEGGRWCCGLARVERIGKVEAGWVGKDREGICWSGGAAGRMGQIPRF